MIKRAHDSGVPFDGPEETHDTPKVRQILREAAADAVVLLKNEKNILPLSSKSKSIAIIGPNAKIPMVSGGGSAALRPTYAVSPLEGITNAAKELGINVDYTVGAWTQKFLPLVDPLITLEDGTPGGFFEFWNDLPTKDFLANDANLASQLPDPAWTTPTASSSAFLADGVVRNL